MIDDETSDDAVSVFSNHHRHHDDGGKECSRNVVGSDSGEGRKNGVSDGTSC